MKKPSYEQRVAAEERAHQQSNSNKEYRRRVDESNSMSNSELQKQIDESERINKALFDAALLASKPGQLKDRGQR